MNNPTTTTSNNIFRDEDIPDFSRWTDGKNIWVVADKKHVWKDDRPTEIITHLFLINATTEDKQSWLDIDVFNELFKKGTIKKGTIKTA